MTESDRRDFMAYLVQCTDLQVLGVYARERKARRAEYTRLAECEAMRRGLTYCDDWRGIIPRVRVARP